MRGQWNPGAEQAAYDRGHAGLPLEEEPQTAAPRSTAAPTRRESKASQDTEPEAEEETPPPPYRDGEHSTVSANGCGFLLGLILAALTINAAQGGPAQVKRWILAKLINKVDDGGGTTKGDMIGGQWG